MTGRFTGRFNEFILHTALQPVYSLAHKRVVGYEALLRVQDQDKWIGPAQLFDGCRTPIENISLDRLSRYLHLNNFTVFNDDINWLFLNVSPQTIANARRYGPFFEDLIKRAGQRPGALSRFIGMMYLECQILPWLLRKTDRYAAKAISTRLPFLCA